MKIRTAFLPAFVACALLACNPPQPSGLVPSGIERVVQEVAISSGTPVTIADLGIEGMSCEMMCGGSIKKALTSLGVTGAEIKMGTDGDLDHAIVTYNDAEVTDDQLVAAIQALYDGQYQVRTVHITRQVLGSASAKANAPRTDAERGVSVLVPDSRPLLTGAILVLTHILRN